MRQTVFSGRGVLAGTFCTMFVAVLVVTVTSAAKAAAVASVGGEIVGVYFPEVVAWREIAFGGLIMLAAGMLGVLALISRDVVRQFSAAR